MNVCDMVKESLRRRKVEGLVNLEMLCGCSVEEVCPTGSVCEACEDARFVSCKKCKDYSEDDKKSCEFYPHGCWRKI